MRKKNSFLILDPFFRKNRVCLYKSLTNFKVTEFIFDLPERKHTHGSERKNTHNFKRKKYARFEALKKTHGLTPKNTHSLKRKKKNARFET